jgi:hypothetical protein
MHPMRPYDPNDHHDEPLFLDHIIQRRGWSHQIHPHIIFPTKEEAFTDMVHQYLQAIQHIQHNAIFELDQLQNIYHATQNNRLGVKLDQHTIDAIKIVLDKYPHHRRQLLTCISPPTTPSSTKPSN